NLARLERAKWERTCKRDLTAWTMEALKPMNQVPAKHHRVLLGHLKMVADGKIDRLMVCMPPGSAKSTYCSVLFPAWMYAQRDNLDMIGASHGSDLAEDFSGRIQGTIRQHSGLLGYQLQTENVKRWRTTNGGVYRAAGVGGSITGRRSDITLIDDPVKGAAEAESETVRQATWEWYQSEVYTRQKPGAAIILVMTRWNEDDLGGRLLAASGTGGDVWTVLKFPALADALDDPLGRPLGAPLWPEWQNEEALDRIRVNSGPYVWGALYQQDPKPRGASFFEIDSFLVDGQPVPMPTKCDTVFGVIDTAIKTGKKRDSTAVTWFSYNSLTKPSALILDYDIIQIEGAAQEAWLPSVIARSEELARYCGARQGSSGVIIEDKATGTVLIQQAQNQARKEGKRSLAHAIDSKLTAMGKDERAIMAAPYVIAGDVKMTVEAYEKTKIHKGRSANHLIVQLTDFRLGAADGASDDLLDTVTYGISITCGTNAGTRRGI
ncbi:MAG TPA: terminase family protein, partial [Candidatus Aquilonibacter sp.]